MSEIHENLPQPHGRWISFDLSSHTGWALWQDSQLLEAGVFHVEIEDFVHNIKTYKDFRKSYPQNLKTACEKVVHECAELCVKYAVKFIVTEHTEGSSFRFSQRFLEWLHLLFFEEMMARDVRFYYLLNSDWRNAVKCYVKYWPEIQEHNKNYSKARRKAAISKSGAKIVKIDGKRIGRIDQKKLSIHIAKEFLEKIGKELEIEDDNMADAINIGHALIKLTE